MVATAYASVLRPFPRTRLIGREDGRTAARTLVRDEASPTTALAEAVAIARSLVWEMKPEPQSRRRDRRVDHNEL